MHTTVAERIMQQISDPVNYMQPLPEVKGQSRKIRQLRQADRGQTKHWQPDLIYYCSITTYTPPYYNMEKLLIIDIQLIHDVFS